MKRVIYHMGSVGGCVMTITVSETLHCYCGRFPEDHDISEISHGQFDRLGEDHDRSETSYGSSGSWVRTMTLVRHHMVRNRVWGRTMTGVRHYIGSI